MSDLIDGGGRQTATEPELWDDDPSELERPAADPERLLHGLNEAQREAVAATSGPLAIIAGAGSGKTRVISHRAAYAIERGVVRPDRILLVTFTEKAAAEMVGRMAALGHRDVAARTFHATALAQLRHFWPERHDGRPLPEIVESKTRLLLPLGRRLPGHYRFTPLKDLASVIEWAKLRRIRPARWLADGGDRAPIPADLFARFYADYERVKTRAGQIDFEDMLIETVDLLESDEAAAAIVRARKTWFSVDEYQDTNPLAERLLELWLGDSRDLAVVGDPDQTIYSFTGATPEFLLNFAARHPGARTVALVENYRSTPQILAFANRLIGPGPRGDLRATLPGGPTPSIRQWADEADELVAVVKWVRARLADGIEPGEIAVLVRINAQLPPIEQALTRAAIPFRVRGQRFFGRPEVRQARLLIRRADVAAVGLELAAALRELFVEQLGLTPEGDVGGDEGEEREASLELILEIVGDLARADPTLTAAAVAAELDRRDADEAAGSSSGVNLLTYHRAKGLEWDAVYLPALEEGLLPIRQAKEDDEVAEERRLLYVGITRARRELALSWALRRAGAGGRDWRRQASRFLGELDPPSAVGRGSSSGHGTSARQSHARVRRVIELPGAGMPGPANESELRLLEALKAWRRERSKVDAVPAYVVAHDSMLADIADARPSSIAALRRVKGMGPTKLERYGPEILAVVAEAG